MQVCKQKLRILRLVIALAMVSSLANAQSKYKPIPLPVALRSVNEEFSGMTLHGGRVYILPQYGSYKETGLNGNFNVYSIRADSINRVIDGKDTSLLAFNTLKVRNLEKFPDSIKNIYQGFETLTIVGNHVYMAMETVDSTANCFLLKGLLDTVKKEVVIDDKNYLSLKRQFYIDNAGFESVTWLPQISKLIAFYEFNAAKAGNTAYLIDTSFTKAPEAVNTPFLYFRNTDASTAANGGIYAINYFWDGDYAKYLNNDILKDAEKGVKKAIPLLKDSLNNNPGYLKSHTFARIIYLKNYRKKQWKQVAVFDGFKNNWEGITLFNKGALIITDANRSAKQASLLAYLEF